MALCCEKLFFIPVKSAFAGTALDVLGNAAASFPARIEQQLEMLQRGPSAEIA
jgi:hypothetical protein